MKAIVKRKVNEAVVEIEIEGKDVKEVFLNADFLFAKDYCNLEGFADAIIRWETRTATKDGANYIYVKRNAYAKDGRRASSTLGSYKTGGYFWNKWEEYVPKQNSDKALEAVASPDEDIDLNDVAF